MRILAVEDLTPWGVSIYEVQQSLTLYCLGKQFSRKSDLPKKFKEKALNICQEIYQAGKDSFVTETNYSYTIWEEEQKVSNPLSEQNSSTSSKNQLVVRTQVKPDKSFSSSPYSLKNYIAQKKDDTTTNSSSMLQVTRNSQNQEHNNFTNTSKEVYRYRGVTMNKPLSEPPTSKIDSHAKTRTYRGVVY